MKKTNNLKTNFSTILSDKYHLTKEGIDGYWANKEKEEGFEAKRKKTVGVCGAIMVTALGATFLATNAYSSCAIVLVNAISGVLASVNVVRPNPYEKQEYQEIDKDYKKEKRNYKRLEK